MRENLMDICKNCGRRRGDHNTITKGCPVGRKGRSGWTTYSALQVFEKKEPRVKKDVSLEG